MLFEKISVLRRMGGTKNKPLVKTYSESLVHDIFMVGEAIVDFLEKSPLTGWDKEITPRLPQMFQFWEKLDGTPFYTSEEEVKDFKKDYRKKIPSLKRLKQRENNVLEQVKKLVNLIHQTYQSGYKKGKADQEEILLRKNNRISVLESKLREFYFKNDESYQKGFNEGRFKRDDVMKEEWMQKGYKKGYTQGLKDSKEALDFQYKHPAFVEGKEKGFQEGLKEGRRKGLIEGRSEVLQNAV